MTGASMAPVIIVGLDTMQGLQAARIFARHAIPVIGVASDPRHYACSTNVCERIVIAAGMPFGTAGTTNLLRVARIPAKKRRKRNPTATESATV